MKQTIRKGVFETNSSSTHAIVIPHKVNEDKYNLYESLDNNYCFDREAYRLVDDWDEKLAYLYITIKEISSYNWEGKQVNITKEMITDFKKIINDIYKEVYDIVEYKPYKSSPKPNDIFNYIDKKGKCKLVEDDITIYSSHSVYVDHVGEFAKRYDFFNKIFNDRDFLKRFIFNNESYITVGSDECSGYYIKTIGFEDDYDDNDYPKYNINEKGEKCPNYKDFDNADEWWEISKKYPITRDNGGFFDKLLEYEKTHDVYLKGN